MLPPSWSCALLAVGCVVLVTADNSAIAIRPALFANVPASLTFVAVGSEEAGVEGCRELEPSPFASSPPIGSCLAAGLPRVDEGASDWALPPPWTSAAVLGYLQGPV